MIAAETTLREWVNGQPGLTGKGNPITQGAFLHEQRSPLDGAYAVVHRLAGPGQVVAEQSSELTTAGIAFLVYSLTEDVAEKAAKALATAIETLTGIPQRAGDTGVSVLVHDNLTGPVYAPQPPDSGEQFCFQVSADFMLAEL